MENIELWHVLLIWYTIGFFSGFMWCIMSEDMTVKDLLLVIVTGLFGLLPFAFLISEVYNRIKDYVIIKKF